MTDYKAVLAPFALCLAGVGRSIFPVSRVCFGRLILRGIGVRRFLF
nr:MAG TPA: hypothetical protein [Caudoviricetes sp.]